MPSDRIHLTHAKEEKLFYVVANCAVFREADGKCLLLKRSNTEKIHPGKWCLPGGKMEWRDFDLARAEEYNHVLWWGNSIEDLLAREVREEAGIEIDLPIVYLQSLTFVRPDGIPVLLMKFGTKYRSGEVKIEENSFADHRWVTSDEAHALDCIHGTPEIIARSIDYFLSA